MSIASNARVGVLMEFSIRCSVAQADERLMLLGNIRELGEWDHAQAVPMVRKDSRRWEAHVNVACEKSIEYKYILCKKGVVGRWETIPGNRTVTSGAVNFALGKPTQQSSTYIAEKSPVPGPRGSEVAVNGNTNGFRDWMCCHTKLDPQPWWQVDLQMEIAIGSIILWNRQDRCAERLFPVWLMISKEPFPDLCSLEDAKKLAIACQRFCKGGRATKWEFSVEEEITGRYIRVQLENPNFLHFAELEVFHRVDLHSANAVEVYGLDNNDARVFTQLREEFDMKDERAGLIHRVNDELFGLENRDSLNPSEHALNIDEGWLSPQSGSEVRIVLGSMNEKQAIHLLNPCQVRLELRVEKETHVHWPLDSASRVLIANTNAADLCEEASSTASEYPTTHSPVRETPPPYARVRNYSFSQYADNFVLPGEGLPVDVLSFENLRQIHAFEKLSDEFLGCIQKSMERALYPQGEYLVSLGDVRTYLFIIETGCVEILGESTAVGERVLGRKGRGAYVGEMALLGGGMRTASLRAAEQTVCYKICRKKFIEIIGKAQHTKLREELLSELIPVPTSSSIVRWDADTHKLEEMTAADSSAKFLENDIEVFRVRINPLEFKNLQFMLDVYCADSNELLGTVYILPSQLNESPGSIHAPIIASPKMAASKIPVIGQCFLRYTLINPLVHPDNNLAYVWRNHWRVKNALDVGHRGLGRSFHQVEGYRSAIIRENTLVSFYVAGRLGADYIEFDVQLTHDRVPVIYHDFTAEVDLEDMKESNKGEHYEIGIYQLKARHLDRCRITPTQKKSYKLQRLIRKHWHKLVKMFKNQRVRRETRAAETYLAAVIDSFPRLKHVLELVPESVGLNIELKYPAQFHTYHLRQSRVFEMNSYVDTILKCVFDHAGTRRILFSCFDPDVCVMLRMKQARYPVFFLTCAGTDRRYYDKRCLSLEAAVRFAKMEKLQGIVSNSEPFLQNPELIRAIKKEGLLVFTWGDKNSDQTSVQFQKMHGVDAVISDNVGDMTREKDKVI